MADTSSIEWTDATWNPIVGCSIVSPGCTNCYAMGMAYRIERMTAALVAQGKPGAPHYEGTTKRIKGKPVWTGKLALAPDAILTAPLRWKRPRRIFVNSMGDLFHEDVPDAWIDRVFAIMALSPQHTFQVLTKRSKRMREYLRNMPNRDDLVAQHAAAFGRDVRPVMFAVRNPLPNVWLGVSAERQQEADERIPDLLATPAAIRFASLEPLLGPIDLGFGVHHHPDNVDSPELRALVRTARKAIAAEAGTSIIDWVIVGGESGPDARPMHPDWARSLRDQCAAAGVPFFFKQWGSWADFTETEPKPVCSEDRIFTPSGEVIGVGVDYGRQGMVDPEWRRQAGAWMGRVTKKTAGRTLDGVEHNGWPSSPLEGEDRTAPRDALLAALGEGSSS